jgi:tetratricopeptide (TPR) repeat protein
LDTKPEVSISDEGVIVNQASAEKALIGVYDATETSEGNAVTTFNNAADNVTRYDRPTTIIPDLNPTGTDGGTGGTDLTGGSGYNSYYISINRANSVIKGVLAIGDDKFQGNNKNRILAETYFLRALAYFELARTFGSVPIVLEPSLATGIALSPKEEVYQRVGEDLDEAERLFDNSFSDAGRSRASLWAVYALKARLYLYTEKWAQAEEYASKVINHPSIRLSPVFSDFFTNPLSSEAIFELVFNAADRNPFYTYFLTASQGGRFYYIPNQDFVQELIDPARGGERSKLVAVPEAGVPFYSIAEYGKQDGSSSIFVLRIAEQILIRAEARLKKSPADLQGAIDDIDEIRKRAGVELIRNRETRPGTQELLLIIENERRYELAFEGHRYSDIIRTGRAPEVFGQYNDRYKDERYWVFPFPHDATINDPDLIQPEVYR